jgi:hypothetical protein
VRQRSHTLLSNLKDRVGPYRPEDLARFAQGMRLAGLPE